MRRLERDEEGTHGGLQIDVETAGYRWRDVSGLIALRGGSGRTVSEG